jgi:predicted metal-binding membrane protein
MYARTIQTRRLARLSMFASGYLAVWAASSIPAFALAWLADVAIDRSFGTALAVAIFAGNGVYQLTPLKYACLSHCRSPLSHLFHYASWSGPLVHLRVGVHHGVSCFGCCWSLMTLMAVFGVMNLWAMLALAGVIAVEKLWDQGERFSKGIGVASLGLAAAVIFVPELAPGLTGGAMAMGDAMAGGT